MARPSHNWLTIGGHIASSRSTPPNVALPTTSLASANACRAMGGLRLRVSEPGVPSQAGNSESNLCKTAALESWWYWTTA
eukprot:1169833-Rhodomonas_salina.2